MSMQADFAGKLLADTFTCPQGLCSWNGSDPAQRFAVYRNNVAVALSGALADNFPVTRAMVGEAFFQAMARVYTSAEPPRSALMAFYGQSFPDFIRDFPPTAGLPYLADLSRLEVLYRQAYHAADAQPVTAAELSSLLADAQVLPQVRFSLHPSLRLLDSKHAVVSLWAAHQHEAPVGQLATVNPATAESALLMRNGLEVKVVSIEAGTAEFIGKLLQELTFAAAVDTQQPLNLAAALELLIRSGAIIGFSVVE